VADLENFFKNSGRFFRIFLKILLKFGEFSFEKFVEIFEKSRQLPNFASSRHPCKQFIIQKIISPIQKIFEGGGDRPTCPPKSATVLYLLVTERELKTNVLIIQ
jgi:hypothetical protein